MDNLQDPYLQPPPTDGTLFHTPPAQKEQASDAKPAFDPDLLFSREAELHARATAQSGVDVYEVLDAMRKLSNYRATLQAEVEKDEHMRKVVLSETSEVIRADLLSQNEKVTEKKLENLARTSDTYKTFLDEASDRKRQFIKANDAFWRLRHLLDHNQSLLGLARAEAYLSPQAP